LLSSIYSHIDIPLKVESGESGPRKSVKNFLTENLTDTQYTELLSTVMDEFRDWKATAGEDESNSEKISEIVSRKLTELGVDENHKEVAEFFNKSLQRSAKFQMMAMEGIDVSHIDIDLMADIEDPIDSILMGMSNGLCGASDIKEFQRLMSKYGSDTFWLDRLDEYNTYKNYLLILDRQKRLLFVFNFDINIIFRQTGNINNKFKCARRSRSYRISKFNRSIFSSNK
jgi:hypothetical protein